MKIAILYICTGDYIVFWDEFYESFEQFFLPDFEKEYFVFTDAVSLKGQETGRVHLQHMEWQPWPIPTLMKFHTFLTMEEKLRQFDYIYQPNSNSRCRRVITAEEFLPGKDKGEKLFFTTHPAKWFIKGYKYPYYRNPQSLAYVPYNRETIGVFGAMNGGEANAFVDFMKEMADRTAIDLKKCIIPINHDESYINNYLVRHINDESIRFLPSDYAYPAEYDIPCERVIELADKNKYFDAVDMKLVKNDVTKRTIIRRVRNRVYLYGRKLQIGCIKIRDKMCDREAN